MSSPKQSTELIDSKVWITNEGAIIGFLFGESREVTEFKRVNQADADYIREQIE